MPGTRITRALNVPLETLTQLAGGCGQRKVGASMRRFLPLVVLAMALSVLVAAPASSAGADTQHFTVTGPSAWAQWHTFGTDPEGCVESFVQVAGFDDTTRLGQPGPPQVVPSATVVIFLDDRCTGTTLMSASGYATVAEDAFQVVGKLDSATLNATIEVFDYVSNTSFPVDISVNLTGIGATTRERIHSQTSTPGTRSIFRFDGMVREATASGTVSDGTTNFTPQPATFAQLFSTSQGSVVITHD